jgi:hypothetical protein
MLDAGQTLSAATCPSWRNRLELYGRLSATGVFDTPLTERVRIPPPRGAP